MSEENVRILRAFYEKFNRGGRIEDVLHYVDPAVEVHPGVIAPDSKAEYYGRQAFRDFFDGIVIGPWETVTIEPTEMIEADDGRILSLDLWRFRGRDGIEIDRELPNLFTLRHGLITRIDGFTDRVQALEAAGLPE
jgi:hypothetical protein